MSDARGAAMLATPALNKGTAFTEIERTQFGLHGLLPPYVETLDEQVVRAYNAFQAYQNDLGRHINLRALQDNNEVLFYRLLLDHIEEMTPIVYTPVVAEACQHFSHIYRRPRGLFISYPLRDSIPELLRNRPCDEADVIVVTDGERILGIGDQGVGGLGIPIGKLSLYTLFGGIHPTRSLPIVLDVGTDNEERLRDPEYLGWRHPRIRGSEYDEFVDLFVKAVKQELPRACLQWEDFATPHARPILEKYRNELLTFNDDIQGTAAVALSAILSAVKSSGMRLTDQQVVFFGAGSAATGVADYLRQAMIEEGLSQQEAAHRFWMIDVNGLLHEGRTDLTPAQRIYAHHPAGQTDLAGLIHKLDATILIGLSTVGGAFTEPIVREMARKVGRPIILPLSNPTQRSEATPIDLIHWTDGRALVATGSSFAPVKYGGRLIPVAQCNNVYIFPALGLGTVASQATRVTDEMILAAARALATNSPVDPSSPLLPELKHLRGITVEIAYAVALEAQRGGVAPKTDPDELRRSVVAHQWAPAYAAV